MRPKEFVSIIWGYHSQLFNFSPLENYHLSVLRYAQEKGYETHLYVMHANARVEDDPNFDPRTHVTYSKGSLHLAAFLWKHRKATVYANTVLWQHFLITPFIAKRSVYMAHDSIKRRSKWKQKLETFALKYYWRTRVIAPGEKDFLLSEGIDQEKIFVVPLVIDTSLFHPKDAAGTGLVFLGNVTPDNDFPTILCALKNVKVAYPDIKLSIIGEVRIPEFDALVAENGVKENIVLLGVKTHKEIAQILPSFAISVSTVISSGQHLSIFESALSGLALCIPNTMQFNTVFNGMALFHELYNPEELAKNICAYLSDPAKACGDNQRARTMIEQNYTEAIIRPKTETLFELN